MKVAFFSAKSYEREYFEKYNTQHQLLFLDASLNIETLALAKGHDAVCVFVNDTLDAPVLLALASFQIKLVALRCAGFNNVDIAQAHALNIKIVRVPAYSPHAVAEHALALLLTLNRKTHKAYNRVKEGNFLLNNLIGFDVYGKTVGIIGTGKIGQCFAQMMLGMGCKVIAFDLVANKPLEALGVDYLPLVDVLSQSDIISLHCPLTALTKHIINQNAITMFKPGMMLINTSRGALIDTKAVIEALKNGKIGYLGIDVYEQEDKLFFHDLSEHLIQDEMMIRLMGFPNVLITAHQGFLTHEALTQIAKITVQNITDFESNNNLSNEVA